MIRTWAGSIPSGVSVASSEGIINPKYTPRASPSPAGRARRASGGSGLPPLFQVPQADRDRLEHRSRGGVLLDHVPGRRRRFGRGEYGRPIDGTLADLGE